MEEINVLINMKQSIENDKKQLTIFKNILSDVKVKFSETGIKNREKAIESLSSIVSTLSVEQEMERILFSGQITKEYKRNIVLLETKLVAIEEIDKKRIKAAIDVERCLIKLSKMCCKRIFKYFEKELFIEISKTSFTKEDVTFFSKIHSKILEEIVLFKFLRKRKKEKAIFIYKKYIEIMKRIVFLFFLSKKDERKKQPIFVFVKKLVECVFAIVEKEKEFQMSFVGKEESKNYIEIISNTMGFLEREIKVKCERENNIQPLLFCLNYIFDVLRKKSCFLSVIKSIFLEQAIVVGNSFCFLLQRKSFSTCGLDRKSVCVGESIATINEILLKCRVESRTFLQLSKLIANVSSSFVFYIKRCMKDIFFVILNLSFVVDCFEGIDLMNNTRLIREKLLELLNVSIDLYLAEKKIKDKKSIERDFKQKNLVERINKRRAVDFIKIV